MTSDELILKLCEFSEKGCGITIDRFQVTQLLSIINHLNVIANANIASSKRAEPEECEECERRQMAIMRLRAELNDTVAELKAADQRRQELSEQLKKKEYRTLKSPPRPQYSRNGFRTIWYVAPYPVDPQLKEFVENSLDLPFTSVPGRITRPGQRVHPPKEWSLF